MRARRWSWRRDDRRGEWVDSAGAGGSSEVYGLARTAIAMRAQKPRDQFVIGAIGERLAKLS
jgi:hypothetical protein